VDREVPDIFSATTEFLELGLEVFTGRLERGGGGGMVERVRRCWWCWWGRTSGGGVVAGRSPVYRSALE